jgi:predicted nucleic acid-binding protein
MKCYADSSFVVELVVDGDLTDYSWGQLDRCEESVAISRLTCLEVKATLHRMKLQHEITRGQHDDGLNSLAILQRDLLLFRRSFEENKLYSAAENMVGAFQEAIACKSADILHVAAATQLQCEVFFTFDHQQANLARNARLNTPLRDREKERPTRPMSCPHCGKDIQGKPRATSD